MTADVGLSLTELGLYSGGNDIASGAFILFLANLAGILVVAGVVLLSQGYGHWKRAGLGLVLVAALSTLLLEPLGESLHRLYVKNRTMRLMATLPVQRPDVFNNQGRLDSLHVTYRGGLLHVDIDGVAPKEDMADMQRRTDLLRQYLSESIGEPVVVEVEVIPIEFHHFTSTPDSTDND